MPMNKKGNKTVIQNIIKKRLFLLSIKLINYIQIRYNQNVKLIKKCKSVSQKHYLKSLILQPTHNQKLTILS